MQLSLKWYLELDKDFNLIKRVVQRTVVLLKYLYSTASYFKGTRKAK